MDSYNLRTRTQTRAHRLEALAEAEGSTQVVPTTRLGEDRGRDRQTDRQITHQTDYNTSSVALSLDVGSALSGTIAHALETQSVSSLQLSEDPTIDFSVQELFAEP